MIATTSDSWVKIALDAMEVNKLIVKKKMQMPKLEDLKDGISMKFAEDTDTPLVKLNKTKKLQNTVNSRS